MDIGICIASHINDIDYVVRAEALGYSHAWFADSQMIWSDCYATLALAATRTSSIQLGTGVAISGTRHPAVNAAGIATINAIAPGRTFLGMGAGNTAMRIMGLAPDNVARFGQYLAELKPLLAGYESMIAHQSREVPIRHVMPDSGFVNLEDPIPLYVSGFGPKSLALAGQYGEGAVLSLPRSPAAMESVWQMIEAGAGDDFERSHFYTTALTAISVLDPGEVVDSPRVRRECGAMAMASLHYAYDQYRNFGHQPSGMLAGIWDDYVKLLETFPAERRHQRIHLGHNCWVLPEEEQFLTPELLRATCLIGTRDELVEQLLALEDAGLNQVMNLPALEPRYDVLERVARDIIPHVRQA